MNDPQQPAQRSGGVGLPPATPFGAGPAGPAAPSGGSPRRAAPIQADETSIQPRVPRSPRLAGESSEAGSGPYPGEDPDRTSELPRVDAEPPTTPPPPRPPEDRPRTARGRGPRRRGLLVAIGIVALALVGGILGWQYSLSQRFGDTLAADQQAARQVTEDYYTALQDGDAQAALATAANQPEETSLLTDEVLTISQEAGGIRDFTIGDATLEQGRRTVGDTGTVAVTYSVGDSPVQIDLPVTRDGEDWKVTTATSRVELGSGLPLTVNNQPAGAGTVELLPGTYTVGSGSGFVEVSDPQLVVTAPDPIGADDQTWSPDNATMADDTQERVLAAAEASLDKCLAQKALHPEGCPLNISAPQNGTIDTNTITYTLLNDPWSNAEVTIEPGVRASATVHLEIRFQASATLDGVEGVAGQTYTIDPTFRADLTGQEAVVTW